MSFQDSTEWMQQWLLTQTVSHPGGSDKKHSVTQMINFQSVSSSGPVWALANQLVTYCKTVNYVTEFALWLR